MQLNLHSNNTFNPPPNEVITHLSGLKKDTGFIKVEDLPALQKLKIAYTIWHSFLTHLPRTSRYTIGAEIDGLFRNTIKLVLLAGYTSRDRKKEILQNASDTLDALKFFLQIAWEMKILKTQELSAIIPHLVEAGNMIGGWLRQLKN